jgi:hypothetical protein
LSQTPGQRQRRGEEFKRFREAWVPANLTLEERRAEIRGALEAGRAALKVINDKELADFKLWKKTQRSPAVFNKDEEFRTNGHDCQQLPQAVVGDSPPVVSPTPPPIGEPSFKAVEVLYKGPASSSVSCPQTEAALAEHNADDDAKRSLIDACRKERPDSTDEEIAYFVRAKSDAARRAGNPIGLLLTAVPKCFVGDSFEQFRAKYRAEQIPHKPPGQEQQPDHPDPEAERIWAEAEAKRAQAIAWSKEKGMGGGP